ncbi:hypothetical protein BJ684DRAFT_17103 [Piptocephalis cylindrospora]|uniref:Uncharacterized protein n=1 Tax=Piptocephalis cylindrospora TaxID=1907219 RepID=A0A4P9Y0Y6_9FUNG|nr:hypothetical protein BJ684DRAFT_17103 [Piptocephalis cylindrospora]|eukprot:RKP12403.1 hypothetical protein BJ684DRAFT_17103 [Piptocephalis cylindrospora]
MEKKKELEKKEERKKQEERRRMEDKERAEMEERKQRYARLREIAEDARLEKERKGVERIEHSSHWDEGDEEEGRAFPRDRLGLLSTELSSKGDRARTASSSSSLLRLGQGGTERSTDLSPAIEAGGEVISTPPIPKLTETLCNSFLDTVSNDRVDPPNGDGENRPLETNRPATESPLDPGTLAPVDRVKLSSGVRAASPISSLAREEMDGRNDSSVSRATTGVGRHVAYDPDSRSVRLNLGKSQVHIMEEAKGRLQIRLGRSGSRVIVDTDKEGETGTYALDEADRLGTPPQGETDRLDEGKRASQPLSWSSQMESGKMPAPSLPSSISHSERPKDPLLRKVTDFVEEGSRNTREAPTRGPLLPSVLETIGGSGPPERGWGREGREGEFMTGASRPHQTGEMASSVLPMEITTRPKETQQSTTHSEGAFRPIPSHASPIHDPTKLPRTRDAWFDHVPGSIPVHDDRLDGEGQRKRFMGMDDLLMMARRREEERPPFMVDPFISHHMSVSEGSSRPLPSPPMATTTLPPPISPALFPQGSHHPSGPALPPTPERSHPTYPSRGTLGVGRGSVPRPQSGGVGMEGNSELLSDDELGRRSYQKALEDYRQSIIESEAKQTKMLAVQGKGASQGKGDGRMTGASKVSTTLPSPPTKPRMTWPTPRHRETGSVPGQHGHERKVRFADSVNGGSGARAREDTRLTKKETGSRAPPGPTETSKDGDITSSQTSSKLGNEGLDEEEALSQIGKLSAGLRPTLRRTKGDEVSQTSSKRGMSVEEQERMMDEIVRLSKEVLKLARERKGKSRDMEGTNARMERLLQIHRDWVRRNPMGKWREVVEEAERRVNETENMVQQVFRPVGTEPMSKGIDEGEDEEEGGEVWVDAPSDLESTGGGEVKRALSVVETKKEENILPEMQAEEEQEEGEAGQEVWMDAPLWREEMSRGPMTSSPPPPVSRGDRVEESTLRSVLRKEGRAGAKSVHWPVQLTRRWEFISHTIEEESRKAGLSPTLQLLKGFGLLRGPGRGRSGNGGVGAARERASPVE